MGSQSTSGGSASDPGTTDDPDATLLVERRPAPGGVHSAIGAAVGRYVVVEEIGRGGMGRVLRAWDPKLERQVALKEVRADRLGEQTAARLVAEARAMAKLSHVHVVTVYDVERLPNGRVVIVMEFISGKTLREYLPAPGPDWSRAVRWFCAAGRGLAAAHAVGLLHRDFKPGNVLIAVDGTAKVTDFGLAKMAPDSVSAAVPTGASRDDPEAMTEVGTVMGTPRYMAPEQHRGDSLDATADQYAFCVALWEGLCGVPPFDGDLVEAKAKGPPAWPRRDLPGRVGAALRRGLAPRPSDRWPTLGALLDVLEGAVDARKRRRRVAALSALAATTAFVAWQLGPADDGRCSGAQDEVAYRDADQARIDAAFAATEATYAAGASAHTTDALGRYADAWVRMHEEACAATTIRREQSAAALDRRMQCLQHANTELGATVEVLARADADVVQRAHELAAALPPLSRCADLERLAQDYEPPSVAEQEPVAAVRARLARARAELAAGRFEAAGAEVRAAESLLEGIDYEPIEPEVALARGRVEANLGNYDAAERALREALRAGMRWRRRDIMQAAAERLLHVIGTLQARPDEGLRFQSLAMGLAENDPVALARAHNSLGTVMSVLGREADAEAEHRRAIELSEGASGPGNLDAATYRVDLASSLSAQARYEDAEAELRRALDDQREALGPEHPTVLDAFSRLASLWGTKGNNAAAEAEHRRVLALRVRVLGPDHLAVAASKNNLATSLTAQGKYQEAEAHLRDALRIRRAALAPDHPTIAGTLNGLAGTMFAQHEFEEAEAEIRNALELFETALGPDHASVALAHSNLGTLLDSQQRFAEAEAEQRLAIASWEKTLGPDHPSVARARTNMALDLLQQKRYAEAETQYRKALEIDEARLEPDHPMLAAARMHLADTLLYLERPAEALELARLAWARNQRQDVPPGERARAAFVLAIAGFAVDGGGRLDPKWRELAELAEAEYTRAGAGYEANARTVHAWIEHPTATRGED